MKKRCEENMDIGITVTDLDGKIIYTSPSNAKMHGWKTAKELIGKSAGIFAPKDSWIPMSAEEMESMESYTWETTNIRKDGSAFLVRMTSNVMRDEKGRPIYIVNACVDISEQKKVEDELRKLCITDSLTGLYNKRHFFKKMNEEVKRALRMTYPLSLIFFDLDDFKSYNDAYGHLKGDQALKAIGDITQTSIKKDIDTAFRYGGDEFAVILPSAEKEDAKRVGYRIDERVRREIGDITISIGIASVEGLVSVEDIINAADQAMYVEKNLRKHSMHV